MLQGRLPVFRHRILRTLRHIRRHTRRLIPPQTPLRSPFLLTILPVTLLHHRQMHPRVQSKDDPTCMHAQFMYCGRVCVIFIITRDDGSLYLLFELSQYSVSCSLYESNAITNGCDEISYCYTDNKAYYRTRKHQ